MRKMSIKTFSKWKTVILSVIVFTLILTEAAPKTDDAENANDDHKWNCNEICSNTGAETHFDEDTLNCKCVVVANVDDTEMALIKKNIQLLNSHSEANIEPSVIINPKPRRHLLQDNDIIINKNIIHDSLLEQAILARLPRQHHHIQPLPPLHPPQAPHNPPLPPLIPPHKIPSRVAPVYPQNPAIQKHLERIRARVQELANRGNARNAQVNLETIRNHLKELRSRSSITNTNAQEQRSARAKLIQERLAKERERIQQLHALRPIGGGGLFQNRRTGGVVGAAAAVATSNTTITKLPPTQAPPGKLIKNPPNSVITQPSELDDEE